MIMRPVPKSIFEINIHDPNILMNIYHEWENVVEKEKKEDREYTEAYDLLYPCGFDEYVIYGAFNKVFSNVPLKTNIKNPLIKKFNCQYTAGKSNFSFVIGKENLRYVDNQFFEGNTCYKKDGIFIMTPKQLEICGGNLYDIETALHLNFIHFCGMLIAFTTIYTVDEVISVEEKKIVVNV